MLRLCFAVFLGGSFLAAQTDWKTQTPDERVKRRVMPVPDTDASWTHISLDPSLKGWSRFSIPPDKPLDSKSQWSVRDGILICEGTGGHDWLRWDQELADFILHVEWRFTKLEGDAKYNSGVFVRNNADGSIWHQAQTGGASGGYLFGNTLSNGAPKRFNLREQMKENRVRPAGEWNVYEIECRGKKITLSVNGAATSEFEECEVPKGYIGLEAEGYRIEFRNLRVKNLAKR